MNQKTWNEEKVHYDVLLKSIMPDGKLMYAGRLLQRAAQKRGDTVAIIYHDTKITYKELFARASSVSRKIKEYGIKPHDRVIICFENVPEFYISYFAVWQVGAVVAPVNTFLKEKELAHIISDAQPTLIITSQDRVELFGKTEVSLPRVMTEQEMEYDGQGQMRSDEIVDLEPDELSALLYTSGTTGLPKGVMLSSKNILINAIQCLARIGDPGKERIFAVLPLFHSFALNTCVWLSIFVGITIILVPKIERRYILEGLLHKPTIFLGVPALYGLMCLLKTAPLDSVRLFVSGGDALPDKIRSIFGLLYRRKICNGYGLTETSPVISADLDDETAPTSLAGRPLQGISCSIRDEHNNECAQGEIGILWVKGDNIMLGYYRAESMTQEIIKDGWLNTGDLAYIDYKGRIVITGREKDLIIHKGINIYPQEIENVILLHPNVIRVGVVGRRLDAEGEEPIAYVQLRVAQEKIERALHILCVQHLAAYKVPQHFICQTKDLPTTATGKVDKKVLRKLLEEA